MGRAAVNGADLHHERSGREAGGPIVFPDARGLRVRGARAVPAYLPAAQAATICFLRETGDV